MSTSLIRQGVGFIVALTSLLVVGLRPTAAQHGGTPAEWRALATTVLGKDTLVVRASWLSREPVSGESTFVGYRVEDRRGNLWASDTIPDVRGLDGGWCDALTCRVARWKAGLIITLTATCWPCYPSSCTENQFVYLTSRRVIARSEWTGIEWDPARSDTAFEWRQSDCVSYALPLVTRIVDGGSRLGWQYPLGTEKHALRVPGGQGECGSNPEPPPPRRIAVYSTADDVSPDSVLVMPEDNVEVTSVLIRVTSTETGIWTDVIRVEVVIAGHRWFAGPGVLTALGYWEP